MTHSSPPTGRYGEQEFQHCAATVKRLRNGKEQLEGAKSDTYIKIQASRAGDSKKQKGFVFLLLLQW